MNKKLILVLVAILSLTMLFTACKKDVDDTVTDPTVEPTVEVTEPTDEPTAEPEALVGTPVELEYTDGFSIVDYGQGIKLLTDAEGNKFFLVPREMEVPELPEEAQDALVVSVPLEKAVFMSTTQVGIMASFADDSFYDAIAGTASGAYSWGYDEMESRLADGRITAVGGDFAPMSEEALAPLEPDMVFVYTGDFPQTDIIEKLETLEIPYAVNNEYMAKEPLEKLEWSRMIAAFFAMDEEAETFMAEQKVLFDEATKNIDNEDKPTVACISIYEGTPYITSGSSFNGKQIALAGGDNVFEDYDSSAPITLEEVYAQIKDVDYLIYASSAMYMADPTIDGIVAMAPVFADVKAIVDGNVLVYGSTFFTRTGDSIEAINDLASVFYPGDEERELVMYEVLPKSAE